jgi:hypothetical protein
MMNRTLLLALILAACDDSEPVAPNPGSEPEEQADAAPQISTEELEKRRAQVLEQVDDLRSEEITVGGAFGFIAISEAIPPEVPGTEAHSWTADNTGAMGTLSWAPRANGGGSTYAQFQVQVPEDGKSFTVVATMDLDGDGVHSTAQATESKAAWVVDPSVW